MAATALQDRKLERFFAILDDDKDGTVDRADIDALAGRLLSNFGEAPDSEKGAALVDSFAEVWDTLLAELDSGDLDGRISTDEYRAGMTQLFIEGQHFNRVFVPAVVAVVRLCDTDDDGMVGLDEYRTMEAAFGLPDRAAEKAFAKLDTDRDGQLTVDELMLAARAYYVGDDPEARGNWLFGDAGYLPASMR